MGPVEHGDAQEGKQDTVGAHREYTIWLHPCREICASPSGRAGKQWVGKHRASGMAQKTKSGLGHHSS